MNEIEAFKKYTGQTDSELVILNESLDAETDPEKRKEIHEEILCISHSWLVWKMFCEED